MDFRALLVAFLLLFFSSSSHAIFFDGELTTSDALGQDDSGSDFYYDLYYVSVDTPMFIDVFMNPLGQFVPYIAAWDGDFTGSPDWDNPSFQAEGILIPIPDTDDYRTAMSFLASPGIHYQIMASTYYYNPTALGTYHFFIENKAQDDTGFIASSTPIQNVPEPASWMLLGLGLIGIGLSKRNSINHV